MAKKKEESSADTPSLEERLKRLEEIARILDVGDRSLDEQLAVFTEGMTLANECRKELEVAELRVEELVKNTSAT